MKLAQMKAFQFGLPLKEPIFVKQSSLDRRTGMMLELIDKEGRDGFGEISPLPGISEESLDDCKSQISRIKPALLAQLIPSNIEALSGQMGDLFDREKLFPSVRFGLEMALLNLKAQQRDVSLAKLIKEDFDEHVLVNGLLQRSSVNVAVQIKELIKNNVRVIKLKVGDPDIEKDIQKVHEICDILEGKAMLRLDANQAWNFETAVAFGKKIAFGYIEYIEEPFKEVERVPDFFHETLIPVALDESILKMDFDQIKHLEGVEVLVIKPTLFGGIEKSWQLAHQAKSVGMQAVISSSYESGLGVFSLVQLASCVTRNLAVGLDTIKLFKEDVLKETPPFSKGAFQVSSKTFDLKHINFDLLNEVEI